MEDNAREIPPEWKRHIVWSAFQWPLVVIAAVWIVAACKYFLNFDVIDFIKPRADRDPLPFSFNLWLGIVVTLGGLAYAGHRSWRAMRLASKGVFVEATFASAGRYSYHGYIRVNFGYTMNDKSYSYAKSCVDIEVEAFETGARRMILVCDPGRPKRVLEVDAVFPPEIKRRLLGKANPKVVS